MKKLVVALFFVLLMFLNGFAWTESTCNYIAITAYSTFQGDLKLAIGKYKRDFIAGNKYDFSGLSKDKLHKTCVRQRKKVLKLLKKGRDFKRVAYELGKLTKAISLLSYPFLNEENFFEKDYKLYAERKIFKFYYAFNPSFSEDIEKLSFEKKTDKLESLGKSFKEAILNDYKEFKSSENFDDLSASFGAASILFSETCLTVSQVVANIWQNAGGKVDRIQFYTPNF